LILVLRIAVEVLCKCVSDGALVKHFLQPIALFGGGKIRTDRRRIVL
jgi:hypothetical protein